VAHPKSAMPNLAGASISGVDGLQHLRVPSWPWPIDTDGLTSPLSATSCSLGRSHQRRCLAGLVLLVVTACPSVTISASMADSVVMITTIMGSSDGRDRVSTGRLGNSQRTFALLNVCSKLAQPGFAERHRSRCV
jgi:hypothetical protein